ncbi:MAG: hypothetical protein QOD42_3400 [Sphingomonadales bacterium]|nr:hypothetical protein [Sphingomonadales bacterium]
MSWIFQGGTDRWERILADENLLLEIVESIQHQADIQLCKLGCGAHFKVGPDHFSNLCLVLQGVLG